ncbi:MAG: YfcE family phosphodiesterase [Erysipelothrix sp.]|nr:YfcE family phosphodiesterase [Erysipelothrix sp.]
MIELIVCSDNHMKIPPLENLLKKYPNIKTFIHCGDVELPAEYVERFDVVRGNNDPYNSFPNELIVDLGEFKAYVTHGHTFYGNRIEELTTKALNNHCALACFGHTHTFEAVQNKGVLCLNPGSLRYNRDGTEPSYAHVVYDEGKFTVTKHNVSDL